ncbi:mandelate racemase/muconate lactonizing enzyme family protein [Roseateles albus]|uniref:Mandelate racemase/muconate lactonizing enzyme family protein n=1 Tax=Roseateles albus TaxID=2987525 RepID=A0ABT5KHY0_9BURK|nr:mandelate racemase/muconate lactonizing enzyme family protein [Roseateles albus]MDC8773512.1 mandelate racemase/muconate lactonizing enzyme family protein [Roseateles albus]
MTASQNSIVQVETFYLRVSKPQLPHMGRLVPMNEQGYIVDPDNGTIYPGDDRTLLLKISCADGTVGWGETYGIVAAGVVRELVSDVIGPFLIGKSPLDVQAIWQSLYNMMRVRGYTTGFWLDALAAADIALWDLCGKLLNQPVYKLLGGQRRTRVPAYITSIQGADLAERLEHVAQLHAEGFRAFKVHAATSFDAVELIRLMRARFAEIEIMLDLHWCFTAAEAVSIARQIEPHRVAFLEAPCHTEDIDGLARVAAATSIPVAAGEEWRTVYDAHLRLKTGALAVVQPEMGRTGITQFIRICQLAELHHARVAPHATIGFGIFMAASLHASSVIESLSLHEVQNHFVHKYLGHFDTAMQCEQGFYRLPEGPGLGIAPKDSLWQYLVP